MNSVLLAKNKIHCNATCINKNLLTSREFILCTRNSFIRQSLTLKYRIDIILCKYSENNTDQCIFSLYQ